MVGSDLLKPSQRGLGSLQFTPEGYDNLLLLLLKRLKLAPEGIRDLYDLLSQLLNDLRLLSALPTVARLRLLQSAGMTSSLIHILSIS